MIFPFDPRPAISSVALVKAGRHESEICVNRPSRIPAERSHVYVPLIYFLFFTLQSTVFGEIPYGPTLEKVAIASGKHLFIEAIAYNDNAIFLHLGESTRLTMLGDLAARKNAPPRFASALIVALPDWEITQVDSTGLRIVDRNLSAPCRKILDSGVKVKAFSGKVGSLLETLSTAEFSIQLDRMFNIITDAETREKVKKMDFHLKEFSFVGSLHGLLSTLALNDGPTTGYYAIFFGESHLGIRFFARDHGRTND